MRSPTLILGLVAASLLPAWSGTTLIPIKNYSFEEDRNPASSGAFDQGELQDLRLSRPTGWSVIAADNAATADGAELAVGWLNLLPSDPGWGPPEPQALRLLAGAAIGQTTEVPWSSLRVGDVLTLTVAAGDPYAELPEDSPRWADDSFFGLSQGLAARISATPSRFGWIGHVVASTPVAEPPFGYHSAFMGDVVLSRVVTAADVARGGNVGVFIASVGSVDDTSSGVTGAGNQSCWDNVRLELTSPRPTIASFYVTPALTPEGDGATLTWEVSDADSVTIDQGIGVVAAFGEVQVSPAVTTTFTLTARNSFGAMTRSVTLTVVPPGPYRYYRFVPTALRDAGSANSVQLAEFQMLLGTNRLTGATASNPGGSNPGGEGPEKANDNNLDSKWLDFNKNLPLVLDFGVRTLASGYRLATANDAEERDPVSWRVDGSHDGLNWWTLNEQTDYATPMERQVYLPDFALSTEPIIVFSVSPAAILVGQSATLTWTVVNAGPGSISIDHGIGVVAASGSRLVSPSGSTAYTISATGGGVTRTRTVYLRVTTHPLPEISFSAAPSIIAVGQSSRLLWSVTNATSVGIDQGIGTVATSGSRSVSPTTTTTYTLIATGLGGGSTQAVQVVVVPGGLQGSTYDALQGDHLLDPIATLIEATSSATFIQTADIDYENNFVGALPGLTSADSFAVLWRGWFDVTREGYGEYTFGTESDDGSVIYLDLNGDGDFAGPGELIVNNNGIHPKSTVTGQVDLQLDAVQFVLGFYEDWGGEAVRARFKKGRGLAFSELDPINGLTGHFVPNEPPGGAPIITFSASPMGIQNGQSSTLSWTVRKADTVRIDQGIGTVAASGSRTVTPGVTTTYILTATGAGGTRTNSVTVTLVAAGPYRYYRFAPTQLREPGENSVQLAEFQMLHGGRRLAGAAASNPGGNSPDSESPAEGNDNRLDTKWLDFTKYTPLVLDFGVSTVVDGYRWATANDADGRDPIGWRVDGSHDGVNWVELQTRTNYPTPIARQTYLSDFSLAAHPPFRVTSLIVSPVQWTLTWQSQPSATYAIEATDDPAVGNSWVRVDQNVASGGATTTRALSRTGATMKFFRVKHQP